VWAANALRAAGGSREGCGCAVFVGSHGWAAGWLQKHWAGIFIACYGTLFSLFIEILAAVRLVEWRAARPLWPWCD
jgi:hypothetical protein